MRDPVKLFWLHVNKTDTCWLWTGSKYPNGYGQRSHVSLDQYAHRTSWILHFGPIPVGQQVLHRCDVPACVNPEHLFLGHVNDNMQDCINKGRFNLVNFSSHPGERHPRSKLTNAIVIEARRLHKTNVPVKTIAATFNVSLGCIEDVLYGRSWKHIP